MSAASAGFQSTMQRTAARPSFKAPSRVKKISKAPESREPRDVIIKSRNRLYGRPATKEEIMAEIVKLASSGMKVKDIAATIGKDRTTVSDYLTQAAEAKLIERTDTGRIALSEAVKTQQAFEMLDTDAFQTRYSIVKDWVANMLTRKTGKPIKKWRMYLSAFKTVCDSLELNPYAIIAGADNASRMRQMSKTLEAFALAVQQGRVKYAKAQQNEAMGEAGFKAYVMAVRDFGIFNGVALPRGISGILSGKKVGYGKYSHVKMTATQLQSAVEILGKKYGHASKEQAAFIFYYLTCARNQAGAKVRTGQHEVHPNGWLTFTVYESKTETPWTKYIPSDNPHQAIFLEYLESRAGKQYLFIDSESEAEKFGAYLGEVFKEVYAEMKLSEEYFFTHPVHCLRHTGAHYWLNRLDYNHGIVCEIGGWKSVNTLIDCYGKPPAAFIMKKLTGDADGLAAAA